jgi:hypothetical protein
MKQEMPKPVADFFQAVNSSNSAAMLDTFVDDALVNDIQRDFWGRDAIKTFSDREIFADHLTLEAMKVIDHYGEPIVTVKCDGTFDKTNLPDPLLLDFYFTVRDDKIVRLIIIHNKPAVVRP